MKEDTVMNMELQMLHVPTASLIGMFFSMVLSIGTPIALLVFLKKKSKADITSFFIGAGTFLLFAMVLEQIMHILVLVQKAEMIPPTGCFCYL